MKTNFKYKFSKLMNALVVILIIAILAYLALGITMTVKTGENVFSNIVLPVIFSVLICYLAFSFFKSEYAFGETGITIKISVAKYLLDYSYITEVLFDKLNNKLIMHYFVENHLRIHVVQIDGEDFAEFVETLLKHNPRVIYQQVIPAK